MGKLWLIWAAMTACILIYAGIGLLVGRAIHVPATLTPAQYQQFRMALAVIGLATIFGAPLLRRALSNSGTLKDNPARAMTLLLVPLALVESIAVYGLVLRLLGGDESTLLAFCGASLLMAVRMRPKPGDANLSGGTRF